MTSTLALQERLEDCMMAELHDEQEQNSQGQTQTGKSPPSKHSYNNIKHIDCHLQTWCTNTALCNISIYIPLSLEFPSSIFQHVTVTKSRFKAKKAKDKPHQWSTSCVLRVHYQTYWCKRVTTENTSLRRVSRNKNSKGALLGVMQQPTVKTTFESMESSA